MPAIKADRILDTSGKCCPMPMVETNRAIREVSAGQILEIVATDPATRRDIPSWCARTGNELVDTAEDGTTFRYYVRRGG